MNYKLFLFLLFTLSFSSCEKDDICVDGSAKTPLLVIEFYDVNNSSILKNVSNLRVEQSGTDKGVVFNPTLPTTNPSRYLANGNKIAIPLNTLALNSTFEFIFNYNTAASNTDIISFFYSTNNVFISRACGYKTNFQLAPTNTIVLIPDAENWIQNSIVTQPNIENENEVHVKIYF